MKIVEASYAIIPENNSPLKKIEQIARVCYKSEDKITDNSYVKMITDLCQKQHYAMLEHASIVLFTDEEFFQDIDMKTDMMKKLHSFNSFLRFTVTEEDKYYISGSIRAWLEWCVACDNIFHKGINAALFRILQSPTYRVAFGQVFTGQVYEAGGCKEVTYEELAEMPMCNVKFVHQNLSVHFVTDRGVSHEMVRHRPPSFGQESTRWCNYALGKYGKEITFLKPLFFKEGSVQWKIWEDSLKRAESAYFELIAEGCKPQEARSVLPNSLKTEIVITGNLQEWHHIFNLRACDATGPAHPQMKQVMVPLLDEIKANDAFKGVFDDLDPHKVVQ